MKLWLLPRCIADICRAIGGFLPTYADYGLALTISLWLRASVFRVLVPRLASIDVLARAVFDSETFLDAALEVLRPFDAAPFIFRDVADDRTFVRAALLVAVAGLVAELNCAVDPTFALLAYFFCSVHNAPTECFYLASEDTTPYGLAPTSLIPRRPSFMLI